MIYFDNSATTKPDPNVLDSFIKVTQDFYGNPSSMHDLGKNAETLLRKAREQIANLLSVSNDEIIFTSGGTEGNNLAIKGIALQHQARGKHIITTQVEHPSVLLACEALEELGFQVTYLPVDNYGRISIEELENSITNETILVSVMYVNNEIGTIQPIEEIAAITNKYPKLFFHVDAVQAYGKIPINLNIDGIDFSTLSGHKIHGLKGTGLLYIKNGTILFPLLHGGGQEMKVRSGTENVAGIVALAKAMRIQLDHLNEDQKSLVEMKSELLRAIEKIDGTVVNTPTENAAPHIINFSIPRLKPEVVIHALEEHGIYISTKSACASKSPDKSSVLVACQKNDEVSRSGLRISLAYSNTLEEIKYFNQKLALVVNQLRKGIR
ncbi:cysteine desulfurase family protein [Saliterribacillus persicus]|uniref:Cysteine desulfurase n=1 Tax=Saliterribacillus persicus TaxID=930114 RepID=A0A368XE97_9BACI|nr:cysteine desulfurase family protein [Saliterribacillus persicus]RCW66293.1 cysteine desulfurase [Saliterribacillus persicus]